MVQNLVENKPQALSSFNLFCVSQEQLELKLKAKNVFKINSQDEMCMFLIFAKHDNLISVIARVRQQEMLDSGHLGDILHEYLQLYRFMCEEDPEYRIVQTLQNAGIIPVGPEP